MSEKNRDVQYGILLIIASVFFLMAGLDLFENQILNTGFGSMMAFILVAIGAYLIGSGSK